jgi:hypothetical protein
MFLPVLLVRDFGMWGFVAFALPNILGAAGLGWVLRSKADARRIVREHATAATLFSLVTITFQVFFLISLAAPSPIRGFAAVPEWAAFGLIVGTGLLALPGRGRYFGLLVWLISVGLLTAVAAKGGLDAPQTGAWEPWGADAASTDVLWLAPVCAFGFLLCPYLDLTFLRARESLSRPQSRLAFSIGFGGLFVVMIAATLGYAATALIGMVDEDLVNRMCRTLLGVHIGAQLVFTVFVHTVEILNDERQGVARRLFPYWIGILILASSGLALGFTVYRGLTVWEITYRLFMAFYGLMFPAYVWVCMIPTGDDEKTRRPSRHKRRVLALAVMAASPFYWMGFIERETWWLGPGLLIVLAARLLARRKPARSSV